MTQVYLKLLLCLLLTSSVTGQYSVGSQRSTRQFSIGQADPGNYGIISGRSGNLLGAGEYESYNQQLAASGLPWFQYTDSTGNTQPPVQTNDQQGSATAKIPPVQHDQSDSYHTNGPSHTEYSNYNPYTEPTGPPYGLRSTGEILIYRPEKLDISKCGPEPKLNPCKILGPQYYELPGYPECYIQCAFGRRFIKQCPYDLVWNSRIKTCDWKTIAPDVPEDEQNMGRKKRLTTERKKRSLGFGSLQYQPHFGKPNYQSPYLYNVARFQSPVGPLRIPLTQFSLHGPVSFPSNFGIPSLTGQPTATQQIQFGSVTPGAATGVVSQPGVARSIAGLDGSYTNWFGAPVRNNAEIINPTSTTATPAPTAAISTSTTDVANKPTAASQSTSINLPVATNIPASVTQLNPTGFNPYAPTTPVSTQVTLIPGPLYPYGPPFGGPFGGPFPKPPKKSFAQISPTEATTDKAKSSDDGQIIKHFSGDSMSTSGFLTGQSKQTSETPIDPSLLLMRSLNGQFSSSPALSADQIFAILSAYANPSSQQNMPWLNQYLAYLKQLSSLRSQESAAAKKDDNSLNSLLKRLGFDIVASEDDSAKNVDVDAEENDDDDEEEDEEESSKTDSENKDSEADSDATSSQNDSDQNEIRKHYKLYIENPTNVNNDILSLLQLLSRGKRQYNPSATTSERKSTHSKPQLSATSEAPFKLPLAMSPCHAKPPRSYTAHPTDPTKYVACFNQFYYQIMECPSSLIYNSITNKCEKRKGLESLCEREQPCKNDGLCYQTGPKSFKCTCQGYWTGERCETPLSSCVNKPCGQGNECLTLKTNDAKQDYVCVCNEGQSYGLSCQSAVPNPCLSSTNEQEQYYPFAFSSQAFIQCNGDILHVQRCPAHLHWNPVEQVCDIALAVPTASNEYQSQTYEITYNNEQPILNNPARLLIPGGIIPQASPRSLPAGGYPLAQVQPILSDQSAWPVKPLEKPDFVKAYAPKPRYDAILGDMDALSYLQQQTN